MRLKVRIKSGAVLVPERGIFDRTAGNWLRHCAYFGGRYHLFSKLR